MGKKAREGSGIRQFASNLTASALGQILGTILTPVVSKGLAILAAYVAVSLPGIFGDRTRLTVSLSDRNLAYGDMVYITAQGQSQEPIERYHYMIVDDQGNTLCEYQTTDGYFAFTVPSYQCKLRAKAGIYTDSEWFYADSEWFGVYSDNPCQFTVHVSDTNLRYGDTVWISVNQQSGYSIQSYRYFVRDNHDAVLYTRDTDSACIAYGAPSYASTLKATVLVFDGYDWYAGDSEWFGVYEWEGDRE